MSTELLQTGVEAVKQGSYSEGIGVLEEVCRRANPRSKDGIKAQMWLVKAYHKTGQSDRAIGLCQEMTESEFTQVQEWANKTLPSLSKKSQTLKPKQVTSATKADSSSQAQAPKEELLEMGSQAIRQKNYAEAIAPLEAFIAASGDTDSKDYQQAQMWLVKAYRRTDRLEEAIAICEQLSTHSDPLITSWVDQTLPTLLLAQTRAAQASESETESSENKEDSFYKFPKAGRSGQTGVKLAMAGIASNLTMESAVTICLLFGMVLALCLFLILIHGSENPTIGLVMSLAIAIAFNAVAFFISPFFMDLTQRWLYGTSWVSLSEIEQYSPETVKVLKKVCSKHKLKQPRLGIIDDENPTAFTYGSLPDSARLVVSQGLFTYLDDEEIAIVYAHELGHIVHWDFAVMTLASTLVQITYLIYIYAREMGERMGNSDTGKKIKDALQTAAMAAYVFYILGTYLGLAEKLKKTEDGKELRNLTHPDISCFKTQNKFR